MKLAVIYDPANDPATNMAQDVALWQRVEVDPNVAYLRFYDWAEPCVTFGYNQSEDSVLKYASPHVPLIRRPTGGGIVFHQPGGVTYSLVIPLCFLPSAQLMASYRWLSEQTVKALMEVGVDAQLRQEGLFEYEDKRHHDVCIKFPAKYEIVDERGQKLVGSAQRKGRQSILQQTQIFGDVPTQFKETLASQMAQTPRFNPPCV
jgi:lipoate-protein ligase A